MTGVGGFVEAREKRRPVWFTKNLTLRVALRARCRAAVAMRALATGPVGRVAVPDAKPPRVPGRCPRGVPVRPRRNVTVVLSSSGDAPSSGRSRIRAWSSSPFPDPLGLNDPIEARFPKTAPTGLSPDLAPVLPESRTWSSLDFLGLWIGLVVCVPAWRFAASFAALGATAAQAFICVFLANCIVLVPMIASAQIGVKYGAPFPVIARASFGTKGSRVPVFLRALVGCGWFGIQTHVGGSAIKAFLVGVIGVVFGEQSVTAVGCAWDPPWETFGVSSNTTPRLAAYVHGASPLDLVCYVVFLCTQLFVVRKGVESIKTFEKVAAPFLCLLTLAMFAWAWQTGGGTFLGMFSLQKAGASESLAAAASETFANDHFFQTLSAVVGFWATMALNISDFSRFAKTQKDQAFGQTLGLAGFMTLFSVVAVAVTTVASGVPSIVGGAGQIPSVDVGDPTALLASNAFGPLARLLAALGLIAATLSTNVAANVVAPANAFVALGSFGIGNFKTEGSAIGDLKGNGLSKKSTTSFESAAKLVALLGTAVAPWRLLSDARGFVWVWLVGHAALLAPVAGVLLADYYLVRRRRLDLDGLYDETEPETTTEPNETVPSGSKTKTKTKENENENENENAIRGGPYWYGDGTNPIALLAFCFGTSFCLPGFLGACGLELRFLPPTLFRFFAACYEHAWFVGFSVAFAAHAGLSKFFPR